MAISKSAGVSRRALLRRTGQLALAGAGLPLALDLAAIGEAAAMTAQDYKALVCVFMNGGNDQDNTVVPFDAVSHGRYVQLRSSIAIPHDQLASTVLAPHVAPTSGRQYALHPRLRSLADMFNGGQAALVMNMGPLVVPTTREQYDSRRVPLPPKLFSHNDQTSIWQAHSPEGATVGWGGRMGDLALAANGQALFTCMSVAGNAVFLAGEAALQYQVGSFGPVAIRAVKGPVYGSQHVSQALQALVTQPRAGVLANEYARTIARAISSEAVLSAALDPVKLNTGFPGTGLGNQLRTVARLIAARQTLGVSRQVFFVQVIQFDHHTDLLGRHGDLLAEVGDAIQAFHNATVELGVASNVTTFTASEFGRTLSANGDGSDHGWGSHHFVTGGAVKGGAFYGTAPPLSTADSAKPEDQWHVGQGRLLPTTSVEQFAATLARWFGVTDPELNVILPNLQNFDVVAGGVPYPRDLGFL